MHPFDLDLEMKGKRKRKRRGRTSFNGRMTRQGLHFVLSLKQGDGEVCGSHMQELRVHRVYLLASSCIQ